MALNDVARFADVPIEVEVELDRRVPLVSADLELQEGRHDPAGRGEYRSLRGRHADGLREIVLIEQHRHAHHGFQH